MVTLERRVRQEAKLTTRREIIVQAIAGQLSWSSAAAILGMSDRHLRRCREKYEQFGVDGLRDGRAGQTRARRVPVKTIEHVCRLKKEVYPDFSMRHFYEKVTEQHHLKLSYTLMRNVLQDARLVERSPGRGQHRRKRPRREMVGMMLHMDASTHVWIKGQPARDLMVVMDDADGRFLYMAFVPQENTLSAIKALHSVVSEHGRFAELYTDRGSHFCRTPKAGEASHTDGQLSRVCKVFGIKQILARSPQARGRSERAFGTIQGRLPQELRAHGVTQYGPLADKLLERFRKDLNRRFTVKPQSASSAFVPMVGMNLSLICSVQHERIVGLDNTIAFEGMSLQILKSAQRFSYARCQVVVHRMTDESLTVTYQGIPIGQFSKEGTAIQRRKHRVSA